MCPNWRVFQCGVFYNVYFIYRLLALELLLYYYINEHVRENLYLESLMNYDTESNMFKFVVFIKTLE
jgi:hypothetical protein